jgi:hypothetical protein
MLPSRAVSEDNNDESAAPQATKVLALPVAERRVIVLAPASTSSARSAIDWKLLAATGAAAMMGPALAPALATGALVARALDKDGEAAKSFARRLAREVAKVIPNASAQSAVRSAASAGALIVAADVAERELSFSPGHPRIDHAYAAHPLATERYLPVAQFHQQLFEQKASELVTLLASLGATRVRVRAARGYREAAGFSLGASVAVESMSAQDGGSRNKTEAQSFAAEETFVPRGAPRVADGLVWYPHEPSWQALARRRIEFGSSTFRIELSYDEDFGVDGGLVAALEGVGIRVGGSFRAFERTRWEFEGTFAPIAAQEHP